MQGGVVFQCEGVHFQVVIVLDVEGCGRVVVMQIPAWVVVEDVYGV
jgi:hypothetical protein